MYFIIKHSFSGSYFTGYRRLITLFGDLDSAYHYDTKVRALHEIKIIESIHPDLKNQLGVVQVWAKH